MLVLPVSNPLFLTGDYVSLASEVSKKPSFPSVVDMTKAALETAVWTKCWNDRRLCNVRRMGLWIEGGAAPYAKLSP
jgi:hypothetical protein